MARITREGVVIFVVVDSGEERVRSQEFLFLVKAIRGHRALLLILVIRLSFISSFRGFLVVHSSPTSVQSVRSVIII